MIKYEVYIKINDQINVMGIWKELKLAKKQKEFLSKSINNPKVLHIRKVKY